MEAKTKERALRGKWAPREKLTKHTNSDRPDGQEVDTNPSLPRFFSLTGKQGIGQILHLVQKQAKYLTVAAKKCQATTMGQGLS